MANPKIVATKPLQEAMIRPLNGMIAVRDIEQVENGDDSLDLWKGQVLKFTQESESIGETIFFSRTYDRDNNEWDKCLREYEITNTDDILDYKFWLIPKEKFLFQYQEACNILTPNKMMGQKSRRKPIIQ